MKKSRRITMLAIMLALTLIFNFVPISFSGISLALMILPVLILAQVEDFWTTIISGVMLGIINLIAWYTVGAANPLAFAFQNPMVSMFPRLLIGVFTFGASRLCRKLIVRPKYSDKLTDDGITTRKLLNAKQVIVCENISSFIATVCGVLTNTFFVGLMAVVFYAGKQYGDNSISATFLISLFSINFAIEITVFSVICPPIVYALRKLK